MELRQLRYLVALAEERHFTRAAAREHVAQPALSQQLRRLEAEVGLSLVNRTTRRVRADRGGRASGRAGKACAGRGGCRSGRPLRPRGRARRPRDHRRDAVARPVRSLQSDGDLLRQASRRRAHHPRGRVGPAAGDARRRCGGPRLPHPRRGLRPRPVRGAHGDGRADGGRRLPSDLRSPGATRSTSPSCATTASSPSARAQACAASSVRPRRRRASPRRWRSSPTMCCADVPWRRRGSASSIVPASDAAAADLQVAAVPLNDPPQRDVTLVWRRRRHHSPAARAFLDLALEAV